MKSSPGSGSRSWIGSRGNVGGCVAVRAVRGAAGRRGGPGGVGAGRSIHRFWAIFRPQLSDLNSNFHPYCWANLNILGQPRKFVRVEHLGEHTHLASSFRCQTNKNCTGLAKSWANFRTLIVIFIQSVGPSLAIWANPVQFSLQRQTATANGTGLIY